MGLLSFLGRKPAPAASADGGDEVQKARIRARQRLVGAIVLVSIGIIAFPLLFETQPRPIPVDIPITIPDRDQATPLVLPPRAGASDAGAPAGDAGAGPAPIAQAPAPAPAVTPAPTQTPPAPAPTPKPEARAEPRPATPPKTEVKPAPAPARAAASAPATGRATTPRPSAANAEAERARALLEGRDTQVAAAKPAPDPANARFIVQVGAYSGEASAREARQKVERLGHKTYTQVVQTASGPRIRVRVGPFGSRAEADRAASSLKAAGVSAAVMTL